MNPLFNIYVNTAEDYFRRLGGSGRFTGYKDWYSPCLVLMELIEINIPGRLHQYSKSQLLSVGIFFARSPSENRNDVARVASAAARFPAQFPQIPLSVISRDASARDATSSIFNDLQAAGSRSNLVGRWGIEKGLFRRSSRAVRADIY